MIIYSYFLLIIFLMDITESHESNFTCFHSEGYFEQYNISQKIISCPNRMCIMLRTYCDNYWAATCFDPSRPMAIFEDFEMSKKVYETRTHWNLFFCPSKTNRSCNSLYLPSPFFGEIKKRFQSLDSFLWTNSSLPKPRYLVISEKIIHNNETMYLPRLKNTETETFQNQTFSTLSMVPDNSLMINTTDELLSHHNGFDHPVIKINLPNHLIIWNEMTYEFRESLAPLSNIYKMTIQVYEEDRLKILHSYRNHFGVETMRWNVQYIICKFSSYLIISLKNNGKCQFFCNFELVNGLDHIGYAFFNQTKFVVQSKKIDSMCL